MVGAGSDIEPIGQCIGCGYALVERGKAACPECGRAYDGGDFKARKYAQRWSRVRPLLVLSRIVVPVSSSGLVATSFLFESSWMQGIFVFWLLVGWGILWAVQVHARTFDPAIMSYQKLRRRVNAGVAALTLLTAILSIWCGPFDWWLHGLVGREAYDWLLLCYLVSLPILWMVVLTAQQHMASRFLDWPDRATRLSLAIWLMPVLLVGPVAVPLMTIDAVERKLFGSWLGVNSEAPGTA